jgi:hypothetical protein
MARLTNPEPLNKDVQGEFERLRQESGLRALTKEESGSGVNRLPAGVYGFTYSPCEDNFPLFDQRDVRSYESHKLPNGAIFLLGFLTPAEKAALEKTQEKSLVHLFPEPKGAADQMVRVPLARVVSHAESSQRKGTGLELTLGPAK